VTKLHYEGFVLQDAADISLDISSLEENACKVIDVDNNDPVLDIYSLRLASKRYQTLHTQHYTFVF